MTTLQQLLALEATDLASTSMLVERGAGLYFKTPAPAMLAEGVAGLLIEVSPTTARSKRR